MKRTSLVAALGLLFASCSVLNAVVPLSDTDGDGMPDFWENTYAFDPDNPADASLDADTDRLTNLEEYRTDTNPRDAASVLRFTSISLAANQVSCQFVSRPNLVYRVDSSPSDSGPWSL